jgi:hypothetical protein
VTNLRGDRRALRGIERDLAHSDPDLTTYFISFTAQTRSAKMPDTEKIRSRPLRLFGLLGRRADRHQVGEDWRARAQGES